MKLNIYIFNLLLKVYLLKLVMADVILFFFNFRIEFIDRALVNGLLAFKDGNLVVKIVYFILIIENLLVKLVNIFLLFRNILFQICKF